jgi:import receptor subunit TOM70
MPPLAKPIAVPVESGVWDRLTNWASENKALVYTIAGVAVVVTGAGVVYYLNGDAVSHSGKSSIRHVVCSHQLS